MKELDEITPQTVSSPSDLIDLQASLPLSYTGGDGANAAFWWSFRGQSQPYGTLAPSFQRIFAGRRSTGAALIIEQDLVRTFRQHYALLQGRTPDMPHPSSIGSGYDLRCLSVMQHYGVPTRLLDWTTDFWTAVYFACASDPARDAELWMYDRGIFSGQRADPALASLYAPAVAGQMPPQEPALIGSPLIRDGYPPAAPPLPVLNVPVLELDVQITPRMKQQWAHHTFSPDILADHVPLLGELAAAMEAKTGCVHMQRVLIAAACKEKALRFLGEQMNLTAGTIFPDVEGLGKFLHWHLESLVTTLL